MDFILVSFQYVLIGRLLWNSAFSSIEDIDQDKKKTMVETTAYATKAFYAINTPVSSIALLALNQFCMFW